MHTLNIHLDIWMIFVKQNWKLEKVNWAYGKNERQYSVWILRKVIEMIFPMTQGQMAVGSNKDEHVVVVLANDGVDMVCGPFDFKRAQQKASKLIMDNFNAIAHKVEIRPLVDI